MDDFDRFMSRQYVLRLAERKGRKLTSPWDFDCWAERATEEHHIGRRKFSDDVNYRPESHASRTNPTADGGTSTGRA
jgi:hypothetical protein